MKLCIKGGKLISKELTKSIVQKIHATYGSKMSGALVLLLLWAVFEGNIVINRYTLPNHPG